MPKGELKLLFFADVHLTEKAPGYRTSSYCDDVFDKLAELREMAGECDATLFGGDLFHGPRWPDTSYDLAGRTIDMFDAWPTPVYAVSGNHDAMPDDSVDGMPFGMVARKSERFLHLKEDILVDIGGWKLQVSPFNYRHDIDTDPEMYRLPEGRDTQADFVVRIAHGLVVRPGPKAYPFRVTKMDDIPSDGIDMLAFGHPHWYTGTFKVNDTWFGSYGSIARCARPEADHEPAAMVITYTGETLSIARAPLLRAKAEADVFRWVEEQVPGKELFAGYVEALETGVTHDGLTVEEVLAGIQGVEPAVVARTRQYLKKAGL